MRLADFAFTAVVVAAMSAPAMAQEGSNQPVPAPSHVTNQATAPAQAIPNNTYSSDSDHWVASGFVGTNFGSGFSGTDSNPFGINTSNTNSSINFGGQVAYLWGGWVGLEGLAEFSPSFQLSDVNVFSNKPEVNTYMGNGIVAGHWGEHDQFMPYFSGGIGAIQMRATVFQNPLDLTDLTTVNTNGSRFGWDLGAGMMGFAGRWGFRGDVRYYRATVANSIDITNLATGTNLTNGALSGLRFWKANVGVAYRW